MGFWRFSFWKNSTFVCVSLRLNITSHLSSDISHIIILKHISALARTLCDTLKMIATWSNKTTGENTAFYRGRNEFVAMGFLDRFLGRIGEMLHSLSFLLRTSCCAVRAWGCSNLFVWKSVVRKERGRERLKHHPHQTRIKPHILQVMPESRSCMIMSYHQISTSPTFFRHQFVSRHFFLHGSSGYVVAGKGFLVLCHSTAFGRSLASGRVWFMVDDSCHLHGDLRRLGLFPV